MREEVDLACNLLLPLDSLLGEHGYDTGLGAKKRIAAFGCGGGSHGINEATGKAVALSRSIGIGGSESKGRRSVTWWTGVPSLRWWSCGHSLTGGVVICGGLIVVARAMISLWWRGPIDPHLAACFLSRHFFCCQLNVPLEVTL